MEEPAVKKEQQHSCDICGRPLKKWETRCILCRWLLDDDDDDELFSEQTFAPW
jgi:hypothetical protein